MAESEAPSRSARADPVPDLELKGFSRAMTAYAVTSLRDAAAG